MKIAVNITKKRFFIILGAILILGGIFAVYAFNGAFNYPSTQAAIAGHSADELVVKMNDGSLKTVQELLSNGGGGGLATKDCYVFKPGRVTTSFCTDGFYVKALYKWSDDNWDGYGAMCCRADGSIDSSFLPDAVTLQSQCPWDWFRINCRAETETFPVGVVPYDQREFVPGGKYYN